MNEVINAMQPSHGMNLVLAFAAIVFIMIIWNIQRDKDNQVDIKDLVCTNGRLNEAKFMRFVTFLVSTWVSFISSWTRDFLSGILPVTWPPGLAMPWSTNGSISKNNLRPRHPQTRLD